MGKGQLKVGEQNMRPSINTYGLGLHLKMGEQNIRSSINTYGSRLHLKMGEQNMGPSINTYGPGLHLKPIYPQLTATLNEPLVALNALTFSFFHAQSRTVD